MFSCFWFLETILFSSLRIKFFPKFFLCLKSLIIPFYITIFTNYSLIFFPLFITFLTQFTFPLRLLTCKSNLNIDNCYYPTIHHQQCAVQDGKFDSSLIAVNKHNFHEFNHNLRGDLRLEGSLRLFNVHLIEVEGRRLTFWFECT